MQTRMEALEQQHAALQSQLEVMQANQAALGMDAENAAVERRRVRGVADDLSGRLTVVEAELAPPEPTPTPGRPDPSARYAAKVGDAHVLGPSNALVTIVMFEDFQCPFCSRAAGTMEELRKTYGKDVRLVFKHLPLPFHKNAMPAALAAEAAGRQGKFWKMHDLLFDNQRALSDDDLERYAKKLKLRRKQFRKDMNDASLKAKVEANMEQASALGVRGTPAFFINGRFLSGAQPIDAFSALVDEELAHAKQLVSSGTRRGDVYDALMAQARPSV